jgi:hypothetical protein
VGFSLKKLVKHVGADLNPFDGPSTPRPASTAQPSIASRVVNQVNPFDNGRTFKNPTPTNTRSVVGQLTHNGVTNTVGNLTAKPVATLAKGTGSWLAAGGRSLYDIGRGAAADITNNKVALENAHKAKQTDYSQFLPSRQIAQFGETVVHPFSKHTVTPKTASDKRLFGTAPINNIQKDVADSYTNTKGDTLTKIKHGIVTAGVDTVGDVGSVYGVKGGGKVLANDGARAANKVIDVAERKPYRTVPDSLLPSLQRIQKQREGYGDAVSNVKPEDYQVYNDVQRHLGVDANDHKAIDDLLGARQTFETRKAVRNDKLQSLPIGLGTKKASPPTTRLVSPAPPEALTAPLEADTAAKAKGNAPLPEYGTKRVSGIDKAFRSTRSIIERQGEHGQKLGSMLQGARDTEEIYQGQLAKQIPTVRALKGKDFENFVEATQGKVKAANPKIEQAVKEWQAVHPAIRNRAVAAGLDVGDLGQNYYPHFIDYDKVFKDKNTYNQAINHLVSTGQAPSAEEAIKLLNYAKDVSRNRSFGNLEAQRLIDLPMYDKTPNSLNSYISGSTHRIAQTETFGPKDEKALALITKAGQQGHDTEAMKNAYDVAVGAKRYGNTATNISNKLRGYQSTTRLGLGAITNSTQNVNTGIVTGHLRTLGAMVKQLDPKTRSFVQDTGAISDAVLNDLKTQAGYVGKSLSKITAPGFASVEKFNRSVSATAGRDYGLRLAQKGDEKTLRKLGVTGPIKNNTLNDAQQIQVARKVVEKTQFKVDPQDLPGWADSPGGKLVSQFRTFSYAQGKFFSNEILKPLAKGNVQPAARLLAALPVGYGVYELKRKIAGRPEEPNKSRRGLEAFGNVGGAGLAVDIFRGLVPLNGKYLTPDRFTSMAAGTLGGPTLGGAVDAAGAAVQAVQKKNLPSSRDDLAGKAAIVNGDGYYDATTAARFGLRQIPIVGTAIQNRVLPYAPKPTLHKDQQQIVDGAPAEKRAALTKDFEKQNSVAKAADKSTKVAQFNGDSSGLNGVDKLAATKKQQAASLKASLSPEDYKLSKLGKSDRQKLIDSGAYSQAKFDGLDNYVKGEKSKLGINTASATPDLYKAPDAEYKALQESYSEKKFNSPASQIKAQDALAKAKVGSTFDKSIRDAYGLSDADLYQYVSSDPKGNKIAQQVLAYSQALKDAGITSTAKFKDKYGNVTLGKTTAKAKAGKSRSASDSKFAAALKASNSATSANDKALQNLIKGAVVSSKNAPSKNLKVTKVALKKQTIKRQKAKVA